MIFDSRSALSFFFLSREFKDSSQMVGRVLSVSIFDI